MIWINWTGFLAGRSEKWKRTAGKGKGKGKGKGGGLGPGNHRLFFQIALL